MAKTQLNPIDPLQDLRIQAAHWIAVSHNESRATARAVFCKTHRQRAKISVVEQVFDDAWNRSGR